MHEFGSCTKFGSAFGMLRLEPRLRSAENAGRCQGASRRSGKTLGARMFLYRLMRMAMVSIWEMLMPVRGNGMHMPVLV